MPYLKLQSSDGEVFQVETQIAKQSNTIRTMLEGKTIRQHLITYLATFLTIKQFILKS